MPNKNIKNFWQAVAVMIGYIIGVGMFGLPFLVSRAGLVPFFVFLAILAPTQYLLHLIYANLILSTKRYHRMPGYTEKYLGKRGKLAVFIAKMIGNYSALLAYIIVTGMFLNKLFSPYFFNNEFIYASILFIIEALIIFFGIRMIGKAELYITFLLLLVVAFITIRGWNVISINNYLSIDWRYMLLPYGAILFSLDGNGSLPIVTKLLKRDRKKIKKVIQIGTFVSLLVVIVFTLVIVGISGVATSEDALTGVKAILDDGVVLFSIIFGVLTMITSFLGVAESIKETLWWDFGINEKLAYILAVFTPYVLYVCGVGDLVGVIGFAGGVAGGLSAIVLVLIYMKLQKRKNSLPLFKKKPPLWLPYFLISLFVLGLVYQIYYSLLG